MSLPHGRNITAEEVERIVGREFPVQKFASLCNSILWATSHPAAVGQATFVERVFVADSGIDAEWIVDVPANAALAGGLLSLGRNVFQYKQRDVTARDRNRIVASLRLQMRRAIQDVQERTGQQLRKYTLFTNVNLTRDEKNAIANAIRTDYQGEVVPQVCGGAELAAFLNNVPHIRSAFFATTQFSTWQEAQKSHQSISLLGRVPPLIGRQPLLDGLKAAVEDVAISVVLIAGVPGVGKSRLALAATEHRPVDVVFALDSVALTITDLLGARTPGQEVVIVIEDPETDRIDELVTSALGQGLKLLMTVSSTEAAELVSYGRDLRIKSFNVEPLSEAESEELLRVLGTKVDYSVQSWLIEQAGGIPGILIAASVNGEQLRIEGPAFQRQVGNVLEARCRVVAGERGLQVIHVLSVMTAVGFSGHAEEELQTVCNVLGTVTPNQVIVAARGLIQAGFLKIRGNYFQVVPPLLANHIAQLALAGRAPDLVQLFTVLSPVARARLLRRIRQLRSESVLPFWDELFERGALSTFERAVADAPLLRLISPAVPSRAASLILSGLRGLSLEQRVVISGAPRRELVWTLDQLLFRSATSGSALRSLSLLAVAENENWGNNASGVFAECFHPTHPQLPLTLEDRLLVLQELLADPTTEEKQLLAIKAMEAAFDRYAAVTLRRSEGPEPFDSTPTITYGQLRDYLRELIHRLRNLLASENAAVAMRAGEVLISSLGTFAVTADPAAAVPILEELGPRIIAREVPIKLDSYVETLKFSSKGLIAQGERFREEADRVQRLLEAVNQGTYEIQVQRWVGSWEYGEQEQDEQGAVIFHGDRQIQRLAQTAADDPAAVTAALLTWLTSPEAKRASQFFYFLGMRDAEARWQERIERIGQQASGEIAFASYYGGRSVTDAASVDTRLDEVVEAGNIRAEAVVGATRYLAGNQTGVLRMTRLLTEGRVSARIVEKQLMGGGWMNTLTDEQAYELLRAIGGPELENSELVLDFLAMWIHARKPIQGDLAELAWTALESMPATGEAWDIDLVAAALIPDDPDRAFDLLHRYLVNGGDRRTWEPLDRHGGNQFWSTLWATDRDRCLQILFEAAAASPLTRWRVSWHLPEILDQEADRELLLTCGQRNAASAEFVSSIITAAKPGFWPIAVGILNAFPDNQVVKKNVSNAAEHMGQVIVGPWSHHYERCALQLEQVIERDQPPARVRPFLIELAQYLRRRAVKERKQEADEEVNW